ncbi:unnamed protein product [Moneuplotes crassus]|uniref:Uncharacterized protein n=1 Tax=Euplotes crassus TaxID=5936 RepID=A0AAD1UA98_EUPCR|nr:unnamed protein product [Moneuplotes crassus]
MLGRPKNQPRLVSNRADNSENSRKVLEMLSRVSRQSFRNKLIILSQRKESLKKEYAKRGGMEYLQKVCKRILDKRKNESELSKVTLDHRKLYLRRRSNNEWPKHQ